MHYPGDGTIKTKRIAILAAEGVDMNAVVRLYEAILSEGGVPRILSIKLGYINDNLGSNLPIEATMETMPSVLFDAMIVADGDGSIKALMADGHTAEFLRDQYRHCKPILLLGDAEALLQHAGISQKLPNGKADPALLVTDSWEQGVQDFIKVLSMPRDHSREYDPPKA
jgi:catalase